MPELLNTVEPGETEPMPKVSDLSGIKEWQWIIGSGVYVDDVKAMLIDSMLHLGSLFLPDPHCIFDNGLFYPADDCGTAVL